MIIYLANSNIGQPVVATTNSPTQASSLPLQPLQLGQLLHAKVEQVLPTGEVKLLLNGQQLVQSHTGLALTPGQQFQVQVVQHNQQIALKLFDINHDAVRVLQQGLRQSLPIQQGMSQLLATLQTLATATTHKQTTLVPKAIAHSIAQVLQAIPSSKQLAEPAMLTRAMKNSGLFLENRFANLLQQPSSGITPQQDFKGNLLKLQAQLQQYRQTLSHATSSTDPEQKSTSSAPEPLTYKSSTPSATLNNPAQPLPTSATATHQNIATTQIPLPPPLKGTLPVAQPSFTTSLTPLGDVTAMLDELSEQVSASLARVQLHQIASLPTDTQQQPSWLLELPVKHHEQHQIVHMYLEKQPSPDEDQQAHIWQVKLALDLPNLGSMYIHLRLHNDALQTIIWAEQAETKCLVEQEAYSLTTLLKNEGLTLTQLLCHLGNVEQKNQQPPDNLVDFYL